MKNWIMINVADNSHMLWFPDAPVMVQKPQSAEVIKGEDLTLHCLALGHPSVEYEWHKVAKESRDFPQALYEIIQTSYRGRSTFVC